MISNIIMVFHEQGQQINLTRFVMTNDTKVCWLIQEIANVASKHINVDAFVNDFGILRNSIGFKFTATQAGLLGVVCESQKVYCIHNTYIFVSTRVVLTSGNLIMTLIGQTVYDCNTWFNLVWSYINGIHGKCAQYMLI